MKSKGTKQEAAAPQAKRKVRIEKLKLSKETLKNLSDQDAGNVKGGSGKWCYNGACWVARAVYGEDNPRWLLFRGWLLGDAPAWFLELYLRHGERFARWLAPHTGLKAVIRLWMDSRIEQTSHAARRA